MPKVKSVEKNEDKSLERLAALIRVKTVSATDYTCFDMKEFRKFPGVLEKTYPGAMKVLKRIPSGDLGLVYHWPGTQARAGGLKPLLFLGHFDVVDANENEWAFPPFAGEIHQDYLYGRGAQDIKCHLGGFFEAVERLARRGYRPARPVYFAFGGDEEVAGRMGAGKIAEYFRKEGLEFEFVLDEGGVISTDGMKAFTSKPVALLGIAEKGMVSFRVSASAPSGHSSMPPAHTAIGKLAQGVAAIEKRTFPRQFEASIHRLLKGVAPHCRGFLGLVVKLYPLTRGLLLFAFSKAKATSSLIQTTRAVTMITGGTKENVLPDHARAVVNFRILPGDTIETVREWLGRAVAGTGLEVELHDEWPPNDPIPAPREETEAYGLLARTVEEVFPEALALPFLMNGSTDSKHYRDLTGNIFRFTPLLTSSRDLERIHGADERIHRDGYRRMIDFYTVFMEKAAGKLQEPQRKETE